MPSWSGSHSTSGFELELAAYNIFDQEFDLAPSIPGWGRSFVGSLKVRF